MSPYSVGSIILCHWEDDNGEHSGWAAIVASSRSDKTLSDDEAAQILGANIVHHDTYRRITAYDRECNLPGSDFDDWHSDATGQGWIKVACGASDERQSA